MQVQAAETLVPILGIAQAIFQAHPFGQLLQPILHLQLQTPILPRLTMWAHFIIMFELQILTVVLELVAHLDL